MEPRSDVPTTAGSPVDDLTSPDGWPAVPIVLGVVGHRDIREEAREPLKNRLKALIREFQSAYAHTPIVLLSSLAEGADQLAAIAARELGVFVRAPLPFAPEVFRRSTSFSSEESRVELDRLLADPGVEAFVVPLPPGFAPEGTDWSRVATDGSDPDLQTLRRACYANAGGYVVRRCHALVALWDGQESQAGKPSGTGEYVVFKLRGRAPSLYPWTDAEALGFLGDCGPVLAVQTPRACGQPGESGPPAGDVRVLVPNEGDELWSVPAGSLPLPAYLPHASRFGASLWRAIGFGAPPGDHTRNTAKIAAEVRQFRETCTATEDFNREADDPKVASLIRDRLSDGTRLRVPTFDDRHNTWLLRLSRVREVAGAVSSRLQTRVWRARVAVFTLLGLSAFAFHLYAHGGEPDGHGHLVHHPFPLAAFVVLLLSAVALVVAAWWTALDARRLDSRALAEALRVRRIWAQAGIGKSVADSYLSQVRGELSWIRLAVQHLSPPPSLWADNFASLPHDQQRALLETIRDDWIGNHEREVPRGQLGQYRAAHHRQHRFATLYRVLGLLLALGGWAALVLLLFGDAHHPSEPFLIATSTAIIAGGLLISYSERESHEELAKQYERTERVFDQGSREIASRLDKDDIAGAQRVIEALGREAIMEHSQWLILRRSRPLELQIG